MFSPNNVLTPVPVGQPLLDTHLEELRSFSEQLSAIDTRLFNYLHRVGGDYPQTSEKTAPEAQSGLIHEIKHSAFHIQRFLTSINNRLDRLEEF